MSEEQSTVGADVRTLIGWSFLVLGAGLTVLTGWAVGGVVGLIIGLVAVGVFFLTLKSMHSEAVKKGEHKGMTTAGLVWFGIYTGMVLIVFLANA
jgi:hypothetical protein